MVVDSAAGLLAARGLVKDFGGVRALDGLDLSVGPRELVCIIGPNGCGKSTLFNLVTGALSPTEGRILFDGQDITGRPSHRIARLGISRKFQVPGIYPELSALENVRVPLLARAGERGLAGLLRRRDTGGEARDILSTLKLEGDAEKPAGVLSHGAKQWLEIGMLLATRPRLMLLDEPTAGMSGAETAATADLILRVQAERDVACVVIEHDIGFVARLGCPVAVMMKGRIVARGSYQEVRRHPQVREGYLGRRA
jgi:ABC-type uncharacterized transport system ATPase subunit